MSTPDRALAAKPSKNGLFKHDNHPNNPANQPRSIHVVLMPQIRVGLLTTMPDKSATKIPVKGVTQYPIT